MLLKASVRELLKKQHRWCLNRYILTAPNCWCVSHLYLARVIASAETPAGVFIERSDAANDKLQNQATFEIISDPHCCLLQTLVT